MSGRYDWSGLYHDANDPRLFVPKRNPSFGWTINVEHSYGRLTLALFIIVPFTSLIVGILASIHTR